MFEKIKEYAINALTKTLNDHGINIDAQTLEKALANSPHLLEKIQDVLNTPDPKERAEKIQALLKSAAAEEETKEHK